MTIPAQVIDNFFARLPLNRDRVYVCAEAPGGCEIYIPALRESDHQKVKHALQAILGATSAPPLEAA